MNVVKTKQHKGECCLSGIYLKYIEKSEANQI